MKTAYRVAWSGAVALLLGSAGAPAIADAGPSDFDASVQCGAFKRQEGGAWTATAPSLLQFGGLALSVAPGEQFAAGSTTNGIAIPVILDRHCGNL